MGEHDIRLHNQPGTPSYEQDWAAWLTTQVELLKTRRFDEIDFENLIDEVESLGRSDFRGFVSAIEVVLAHMLKWEFQPAYQSKSWARSIALHRERVASELEESPSYRNRLDEAVAKAYRGARFVAERETGLLRQTFPAECPYTWEQIMTRELRFTPSEE
jgi:Domain of unknown function DUF29